MVVLVGLAGCNSAMAGDPKSTATESQTSEEPTTETTSEPEEPDYSLARLCELISPEEAQELGGSAEGEEGNAINDGHAVCKWSEAMSLIVGFQEGVSSTDPDTGPGIKNTPTTIDGLPAMQSLQTDPAVICEVMVDLPSGKMFTSSAAVLSAGEGKYDPCQVATELSNLIIPRVKDQ
ncbi:DUF3558 domain-containing protein [Actinophytocola sp. NPDC049390]|uniref:DUF3558 domain-containing protein n=1 Tax=Actinophytocola sp. NPDC049390 TaxID=3363894 RepID=UPI0037BCA99E